MNPGNSLERIFDEVCGHITPPNELANLETSEGITAQDADMSPDEEALQVNLRG